MKKEDFGKVSKTRNSIISSLLARTKYVEKMGTGILRMNEAMEKAGLSEIEFDFDDYTFSAALHDNESMDKKGVQKTSEKTSEKTLGEKLVDGLVENQRKMLLLITNNPHISKKEMADTIGISTTAIDKNINTLKKIGILTRIGSAKSGHWEAEERARQILQETTGEKPGERLAERLAERLVDGLAGKLVDGLVENQRRMLVLIANNPHISKKEMADTIGISTTAIDKNIKTLKKKGIVTRIGPNKGGYWKVIES